MRTEAQKKNQSGGERKVSDILDAAGMTYAVEYVFPDLVATSGRPLRFDFAVFDDAGNVWFLIEYQGEQHYQKVGKFNNGKGLQRQQFNDRMKAEYCLDRNLPLVSIPYVDFHYLDYDYIMQKALL